MEQYLQCGIAQKIEIESVYKEDNKTVLERIGENIDLSLYNINKGPQYIKLEMKKEIFEKYAVDFIKEQLELFWKYDKRHFEKNLQRLRNLKYEELIDIAKEKDINNFQFLESKGVWNNISYLDTERFCTIYCDSISYMGLSKVNMNNYNSIFTYLRNCIIKSSDNPIKTSAVITMYE